MISFILYFVVWSINTNNDKGFHVMKNRASSCFPSMF